MAWDASQAIKRENMKKLSRIMLTERGNVCDRLRTAFEALEKAVDTFNETMTAQWEDVDAATTIYNAVVAEAREWFENVANEIQEEIDSHNEKWQDSERGQAYMAWQVEYEQVDLEEIEMEQPQSLELGVSDQSEILEGLPEES